MGKHFLIALVAAGAAWAGPCEYPGQPQAQLSVHDGFVEFMEPQVLDPLKAALPVVSHTETNTRMRDPETMWYDEASMVFLYQDSVETVVGGRANCVGRKVGEANAGSVIGKLRNFFGPDYRFLFPFRKAAGTDQVPNAKVINFWSPPRVGGMALPVKWWRNSSRGRWNWVFPVGTLFGEVLYQQGPGGRWYVFEIRTRKRYLDGWEVNLFRPFNRAQDLAQAIKNLEPGWPMSINLRAVVNHLENPNTLEPHRLESKAFAKVFPAIDGALDWVPEIEDRNLVARLLTQTPFSSAEGMIWKESGSRQTYAPTTRADFHVVPKNYEMGLIPVNEVSCNRCHSETGRRLGEFEFDIILYGEIWGEDRIFTWHLFDPHRYIYDTWDDADNSRKLNPRMVTAKLLKNEKPASGDPLYKPLPGAFKPDTARRHHE